MNYFPESTIHLSGNFEFREEKYKMLEERAKQIAEMLNKDENYTKELLALDFDAAAKKLSEDGYDFTADELKKFQEEIADIAEFINENGELDEESLSKIAGGKMSKEDKIGLGLILGESAVGLGWAGIVAVAIGW